jgi:hypothetical protein
MHRREICVITVEVLFFEGCPNYEPTLRLVREVVAGAGGSAEIREVEIKSPEEAESRRFLGSPSVRINGCDIEPGASERTDFAFGCRVYGSGGVPPRDWLVAVLEKAT